MADTALKTPIGLELGKPSTFAIMLYPFAAQSTTGDNGSIEWWRSGARKMSLNLDATADILYVQGNTGSELLAFSTDPTDTYTIKIFGSSNAGLQWNTDGGGNIGQSGANRPNTAFVKTSVAIGASNSGRLTIGGDNGTNPLEIYSGTDGQIRIQTTSTSSGAYLAFRDTGGSERGEVGFMNSAGTASLANKVYLYANGTSPIAFMTNDILRWQIDGSTGYLGSQVAGIGLSIKEGSNARMGVSTLSGGTVVVSNTSVTANTRIFLTDQEGGTIANIGVPYVSARSAGVSFTISSLNILDNSPVAWMLVEPA